MTTDVERAEGAMRAKLERNCRVQHRYDELLSFGQHGLYETMFRIVREEVERALAEAPKTTDQQEAARYRWIRDRTQKVGLAMRGRYVLHLPYLPEGSDKAEQMDAYIDGELRWNA